MVDTAKRNKSNDLNAKGIFKVNHVGKGPWLPIQCPTMEDRNGRVRREEDKIKFIDLRSYFMEEL